MNYFPFHVGDYLSHTAHLDPMEDLAYRRMLDLYYLREAPLPTDVTQLARLIRMRDHEAEVISVLEWFFVMQEDGWHNERCDAELARMLDKQSKAKASAQASVNARRANAERTLEPTFNERSTKVELPTPTPTPNKEKSIARASRLPTDWEPGISGNAFAEQQGIRNGRVIAELEKFRDYWCAQPGQKGVKADWQATWRNWVRKAAEGAPPKVAPGPDMFRERGL